MRVVTQFNISIDFIRCVDRRKRPKKCFSQCNRLLIRLAILVALGSECDEHKSATVTCREVETTFRSTPLPPFVTTYDPTIRPGDISE
jgi:hypothetical protein